MIEKFDIAGYCRISVDDELDRVVPAVAAIRARWDVALSVDTRKATVARAAVGAGADIVNDVAALGDDPDMAPFCAAAGVPVTVNRLASMYTVFFSDGPLRNFEDVKNSDTEMYSRFFRAMRERNIFVAPSAFEVAMVSFAHTEEDFAKTLDAVRGIKL